MHCLNLTCVNLKNHLVYVIYLSGVANDTALKLLGKMDKNG